MATKQTKREEMAALMSDMQAEQNVAMQDAAELFRSDDITAFTDQMTKFRDSTIPGSPYDQIFTSVLSVLGSCGDLLNKQFPAAKDQTVDGGAPDAPTE